MADKPKKTKTTKTNEPGTSALAKKAFLIRVTCHWWAPFATDDNAREQVETNAGAKKKTTLVRKRLLGDATAEMWSILGQVRKYANFMTLPWDKEGWGVLASAANPEFVAGINELKSKLEVAKAKFKEKLPESIENDKKRLGKMWNADDYLGASEVDKRIGISLHVKPIPSGKHFMADVGDEQMAMYQKQIDEDSQAQLKQATGEIWRRFSDVVGHMVEALQKYQPANDGQKATGAFRDSVVGNIEKLLEVVPVLNITGDPEVEKFANEIREKLVVNSAEVLRDDTKIRTTVAKQAEDILSKMNAYLGG